MPKRKAKDAAISEVKDAPRRTSRRTGTKEVKEEARKEPRAPAAKKSKNAKPSRGEKDTSNSDEEEPEATKPVSRIRQLDNTFHPPPICI